MNMHVLSFARSIVTRHTRHTAFRPRVIRVLLRRATSVARMYRTRRAPGSLSRRRNALVPPLHLTLRLAVESPHDREAWVLSGSRVADPARATPLGSPQQSLVARTDARARELALDRVLAHGRRIERPTTPSTTIVVRSLPPVARDMRRPPAADEQFVSAFDRPTPPPRRATLDAQEMSRVTDAVMQSIDHRLRAFRERRGRV